MNNADKLLDAAQVGGAFELPLSVLRIVRVSEKFSAPARRLPASAQPFAHLQATHRDAPAENLPSLARERARKCIILIRTMSHVSLVAEGFGQTRHTRDESDNVNANDSSDERARQSLLLAC